MSINWKSRIKDIILYRGEDYYLDGKVKDIKRDGDVYSAHVEGTETYDTSVEVKNGELLYWSCDCPYDRGICKHVAALLFAIENEIEDDKNSLNEQKTLQNKDKSEEKSIKYIQTSLNKLSHEALLEFTNKFIELHPLDKVYKMESFIRDSLGEKASFDEETYSYYLSYLDELVEGDLYIELEDYDDWYYSSAPISDDHGITKELKNIILFTEKLFDNSFFKEAQTLIFKLLTIEVSQVYDYGDGVSEHISAIVDSFNAEKFFKMYLKCYEETKTDSIKELAEVICESITYFKDEKILSSVPNVKEVINYIVFDLNNGETIKWRFKFFAPVFREDYAFFKSLLIKEISMDKDDLLITCFDKFLESFDKDELIDVVEYFKDILSSYPKYEGSIYLKIYSLYKNFGFDYIHFLFKSFELGPSFEKFLTIYEDNKTLPQYRKEIEEVSLSLNNDIVEFFFDRSSFTDLVNKISGLGSYEKYNYFKFLSIALLRNVDVNELVKYPEINNFMRSLVNGDFCKEDYLKEFTNLINNFNSYTTIDEYLTIEEIYSALADVVEESIVSCFNGDRLLRGTWPKVLRIMDSLAMLLKLNSRDLWLKYRLIYKRFKEFR